MTASAISNGGKKATSSAPWQKVKIDRQIVAITVLERASTVYTDDQGIVRLAKLAGVLPVSSWELSLPPEDPQGRFDV